LVSASATVPARSECSTREAAESSVVFSDIRTVCKRPSFSERDAGFEGFGEAVAWSFREAWLRSLAERRWERTTFMVMRMAQVEKRLWWSKVGRPARSFSRASWVRSEAV